MATSLREVLGYSSELAEFFRHLSGQHDQKTHGRGGGLRDEQWGALTPAFKDESTAGSWYENTRATMDATEEGKLVADFVDDWNSATSVGSLRGDIHAAREGLGTERGQATLDAIRGVPYESPALYRGVSLTGDTGFETPADLAAKYAKGTSHDMMLGSFTSDPDIAARFASKSASKAPGHGGGSGVGGVPTTIRVEAGGRFLPIENLSAGYGNWHEREWIGGGRFEVTGVQVVGGSSLSITMRQTENL